MTLLRHLVGVASKPAQTFAALDETERHGPWSALLTGIAWSAFLAVLAVRGHEPSGPLLLPIPRAAYYTWEAALVVPTYIVMFLAFAGVLRGLSKTTWRMSQTIAGSAMAVSSITAFLLPDVVVYFVGGFESIGSAMKYYAPFSAIWGVTIAAVGLRSTGASLPRAIVVGLVAWIAHMMVGAPVLR